MNIQAQERILAATWKSRGFALVVTLSLMILLTLIAVGLLSLSSVALRSSSQTNAMSEARANARLALMFALGDLQKHAGTDRAVTATSEIISTAPAKPHTAGIWESWWDFNPNSSPSPDYISAKKDPTETNSGRFRRWLVSSADLAAPKARDFVTQPWTAKTIELVGNNSLGAAATAASKVSAGLVPVSKNGKTQGSYGWHVADESVKARVNLYRDPNQNATLAQKRALLAGHRPDPSVMKGSDGSLLTSLPTDLPSAGKSATQNFTDAKASVGKVIDLDQAELLDQAKGKIKPFRNDITPHSLGVLADVRGGGLKQDLSSIFEMGSATANTLPSDFSGKKLYASTHGITDTTQTSSDPNWSALAGYYNSFRSLSTAETNPTFAVKPPEPLLSGGIINPVPGTYNPAPVIAKVDTVFSLVARPFSDTWIGDGSQIAKDYDAFIDMIFTPVVTLHNPYNVNISFQRMNVKFKNVPIAFRFMATHGASPFYSRSVVSNNFESLNEMVHHLQYRGDKEFGINIANWSNFQRLESGSTSDEISGPIVMKPGQTLICGPYIDPQASFGNDAGSGSNTVAFDWQNKLINKIKARPGFVPGLGFEVYSVCLSSLFKQPWNTVGHSWNSYFMLRDANRPYKVSQTTVTDQFYVEFKAQQPRWQLDAKPVAGRDQLVNPAMFEVTAQIQATDQGSLVEYAKFQFDYRNDATLKSFFNDQVYRYPPTGNLTITDIYCPDGKTYSEQGLYAQPFAIFSAYARTSNGGVFETGKRTRTSGASNLLQDGRLAGKPFLFHNQSRTNSTMNLATDKPGLQAHELNLQPFLSEGDFQDYMDVDANRVPSLTGNKTTSGVKSGSYFELPSGPLQTIADFRRSNALTTARQPHFVQPVGNSLLHPLMSPEKVIEDNPSIAANKLLDHSVLANHALYDRFYFSTFATRGSTTPDTVFEQFMNGSTALASQAFQPYLPGGKTVATAKAELFASGKPNGTAYKTAAEYQMIRGSFNVNSTSVQAWKAVLASMNKSDVATLWARNAGLETKAATGAPIAPMSLVNGGPIPGTALDASKIDNQRTNTWNGYRELTEPELEKLAVKIVDEVRARGPFLSMSEFVNRQIGSYGDLTKRGAVEAAIAKAEINEKQNATSAESFLNQVPITTADVSDQNLYNYKTPDATTGNPAAGAPGWVSQGDLLRILEPAATVRGDTFVIRTYGEAQDNSGNITARAYAEAVVQRVPEYLDPADRPSLNVFSDPAAKAANKTFGRRINIVSFRWLSEKEI